MRRVHEDELALDRAGVGALPGDVQQRDLPIVDPALRMQERSGQHGEALRLEIGDRLEDVGVELTAPALIGGRRTASTG